MTKVYVLDNSEYSEGGILAIYSNKEEAERVAALFNAGTRVWLKARVEEWEMDAPFNRETFIVDNQLYQAEFINHAFKQVCLRFEEGETVELFEQESAYAHQNRKTSELREVINFYASKTADAELLKKIACDKRAEAEAKRKGL